MKRCFVVGCGKCGTTTLADYLAAHPQVAFSSIKETNFFSTADVRARGMEWYDSLFDVEPQHRLLAEASPSYSFDDTGVETAHLIAARWPDARIIYIGRNPFDRLRSVFRDFHHTPPPGIPLLPFNLPDALDARPQLITNTRYWEMMQPYRDNFPADQLLYLALEELAADHRGVLSRITSFLDIDPVGTETAERVSNPGDVKLRDTRTLRMLNSALGPERVPRSVAKRLRRPWHPGEIGIDDRARRQIIDMIGDDARTFLAACGLPTDFWGPEFA